MAYANPDRPDEAVYWLLVAARGGNDEAQEILRGMAAVARDKINLRQKASTSGKIVDTVNRIDQLVVLAERPKWLRVGVVGSGRLAWIYRRLVAYERP